MTPSGLKITFGIILERLEQAGQRKSSIHKPFSFSKEIYFSVIFEHVIFITK